MSNSSAWDPSHGYWLGHYTREKKKIVPAPKNFAASFNPPSKKKKKVATMYMGVEQRTPHCVIQRNQRSSCIFCKVSKKQL